MQAHSLEKHTHISNSLSIVDISRVKRSCFLAFKRPCFLASTQTIEEALLRCSASKESPSCPWNSKGSSTRLTKLQKFPEIPVPTPEERCVSHHRSRRAPFSPPQVEMRVDCPASPGKECRRPRCTLRGGWYLLATGGEPRGLVIIQKPRISPSTRHQAFFPSIDSNVGRESTHNMKGVLIPRMLIQKEPQVPNSTRLEA